MRTGTWPRVEQYVEIERKEAVQPARNAGTKLLKKISEIETRIKHAMI